MSTPNFIITDAELIKQITIKDFDHFVNHDKSLGEDLDKISGNMLFTLTDEKWRNMRNILSPIFTSSKMKMMFGILSESANDFIEHFEEKSNGNGGKVEVDCKDAYSRYTVDGISTAVLGFKGDCIKNEKSELFKFALSINSMTFWQNVKIFTFLLFRWLYKFLNMQITTKEIRDFFYNAIVKVMNERDKNGIFRPDVVQLLLQAKKGQLQQQSEEVDEKELSNFSANIEYDVGAKNKKLTNWTDEQFMAQGFIFFSAGFETTNILLQISTYLLAKNKEAQQELIDEIDDVVATLDGKPLTYEVLHKMRYLDNVISESLRWWPPVFALQRQCNKDIDLKVDGRVIKIREGDLVSVPSLNIHHDPRYYKDPKKFDPHRFDDDRKEEIVQGSYVPFGSGPRVCIGSR
jgi:cytochrome P450 family 9